MEEKNGEQIIQSVNASPSFGALVKKLAISAPFTNRQSVSTFYSCLPFLTKFSLTASGRFTIDGEQAFFNAMDLHGWKLKSTPTHTKFTTVDRYYEAAQVNQEWLRSIYVISSWTTTDYSRLRPYQNLVSLAMEISDGEGSSLNVVLVLENAPNILYLYVTTNQSSTSSNAYILPSKVSSTFSKLKSLTIRNYNPVTDNDVCLLMDAFPKIGSINLIMHDQFWSPPTRSHSRNHNIINFTRDYGPIHGLFVFA